MHVPAISTFASHSISTPSSSSVPKTTFVAGFLLRHGILCCVITNPRMARINSPGSSVPSTSTSTTDPYIPYRPLFPHLNPSVIPHARVPLRLTGIVALPLGCFRLAPLHLVPFQLRISCHWNCFFSSRSLMVKKPGLRLTDLIMPGWSKILWDEDCA